MLHVRENTIPLPVFNKDKEHAKGAARLVCSSKIPHQILTRANPIWWTGHANFFYNFSYKAINPTTYVEQKLGLTTTTAILNQILCAHKRTKTRPAAADDQIETWSLLLDNACYLSTNITHMNGSVAATDAVPPISIHNTRAIPVVPVVWACNKLNMYLPNYLHEKEEMQEQRGGKWPPPLQFIAFGIPSP